MTFSLNEDAELEFLEAIAYIQTILSSPYAWPSLSVNLRRHFTHRFPYVIIYEVIEEDVFIWAVMQQSREPGYWSARLPE